MALSILPNTVHKVSHHVESHSSHVLLHWPGVQSEVTFLSLLKDPIPHCTYREKPSLPSTGALGPPITCHNPTFPPPRCHLSPAGQASSGDSHLEATKQVACSSRGPGYFLPAAWQVDVFPVPRDGSDAACLVNPKWSS